MLKTKLTSLTLTGGDDTVTDSTIPLYRRIQIENKTGADIQYKINGSTDYVILADGEMFYLDSDDPNEACQDTVTMKGTGTIKIEIQYYV